MHSPTTRRDDLDGLRGLAIALVVIYHVWFGRVSGGVDVFLVLSGFFFGGRLLRLAREHADPPSLRGEVTRLARRLLPALVVVLAGSAALTVLIQPQTRWETFADQSVASLSYFQNWHLAGASSDYLRAGEAVSPLQHIWSMSVQGQFFLAMLVIAAMMMAATRKHAETSIIAVAASAFVASFGYAAVTHEISQSSAYYDTFARAWELLAGVLAAAIVTAIRWPKWLRIAAGSLGLVAILACGVVFDGAAEFPGPWTLVPVVATILIVFSGANAAVPWPQQILGTGLLVTLGAIAYSLYLWHWPLLIFWLAYTDRDAVGVVDGALVIATSVALAYLTVRVVENPLRTGHRVGAHRFPSRLRRPTALVGTTVALLAVALTATSFAWQEHVQMARSNGKELQTLSMRDYPGGRALLEPTKVAKLPMRPTVLEAADDIPATTIDGCIADFDRTDLITCVYGDPDASRAIALAGGSHSEHWITALDELGRKHGFKVVTYLKMGCPLTTDTDPLIAGSNDHYPQCATWVREAMHGLIEDRPDYVFVTTTRPIPDEPGDVVPDSYLGIWDELHANNVAILGIRDTPWMFRGGMLFTPADCLASGGDAEGCGLPRSEALADRNPTLDYADRYPLLTVLDLSDAVCGPETCRAVEGNVLVYHDAHHLSATYVRTLTDELARQLAAATGWWR